MGAPPTATNINCGNGVVGNPAAPYPPPWTAAPGSGYSGTPLTQEFTKILPDGQLTPGAHVQYFVRKSIVGDLVHFEAAPDTQKVAFQPSEASTDGHRWQQFGVLPDRWKNPGFGGMGSACMLFIDGCDRRGDERWWVSLMDSVGGTTVTKRGAHNGWSAPGDFDWTQSIPADAGNGGNPDVAGQPWAVAAHRGQPGTIWDMFGLKAAESITTAGSIGNRSAGSGTPLGLAAGKTGAYGPSGAMLRTFYRMIVYTSGDLGQGGSPLIGPYPNKTDDDVGLFNDFANTIGGTPQPRFVWFMGRSFAESQSLPGNGHATWLVNFFAANTTGPGGAVDYYTQLGSQLVPDLIPQAAVGGGPPLGVLSTCLIDNDVLSINTGIAGATAAWWYQNAGIASDPQEASVYAPVAAGHAHISLLDGFRIQSIGSRFTASRGGLHTFMDEVGNVFGSICPLMKHFIGVGDQPGDGEIFVDFMNLRSANPVRSGEAQIAFGVRSTERVEVKVYDVTGRLVKTVANRVFPGGVEHTVTWDGTDHAGQSVARGVYFYQLRSPSFTSQKKLTLLRN